jgi:small conductance mechanosensitive channel
MSAMETMVTWLVAHGPKLLIIAAGTTALLWLGSRVEGQLVEWLMRRMERMNRQEREARVRTLVQVCHNTAAVAIVAAAVTMSLSEIGVDVGLVLGSAAVVGLAVAFGAQNLIRDYFCGFIVLIENQYKVGDVVKIAGVGGVVERMTLRITALRDEDGTLHFIPNGQITLVSNKTHGWSRALFEIQVSYREDVDRVMDVLCEIGRGLRQDPAYAPLIVSDPEMLGVDQLGDSAIVIKFFMKTQPMKRWGVKREMLRRIKKRFDELGIEIPFPQRTVYHRYEGGPTRYEPEHSAAGEPVAVGRDGGDYAV